ncbi:hypothetical protein OCU04_008279 [Sclerotinia nivalis]|uniref:Uncharacterized protein n=1 Tax=Sclerotinia nivalis TaxID=352851 RepID=A0A9X0AHS0_9HELO|nr:hypothetical protein OCU04_008279 [Sclerotinia nivalis]
MCQLYYITYSCYTHCKTGTKDPMKLIRCELFRDTENLPWDNDRCSDEDGGNGERIPPQTLRLKQRCPTCVTKAVAARVAERKEREEKGRDAEGRGERGEVLRQLRLEEDEDEQLTPRVSQCHFASTNVLVCGQGSGKKVERGVKPDLAAKMEDELKAGASSEEIVDRPAPTPATTPFPPMSMLLSGTLKAGEGSPKFLADSDGSFGLGIYF